MKKKVKQLRKQHDLSTGMFAVNKKARHDYHIQDTFVAGIVLTGVEVKAIRTGKLQLRDTFAKIDRRGELWLLNAHIGTYQGGVQAEINPTRKRKLLLHKKEISRLESQTRDRGHTIVPLKAFDVRGRIKIEIGVAKGKKLYDKKEDKKIKDLDRELKRELKSQKFRF